MAKRRQAKPGGGKIVRLERQAAADWKKREARVDPKPPKRHRDTEHLMSIVPAPGDRCPICGRSLDRYPGWSRHHVLRRRHGGDDFRANIVILCGDGIRGCHGKVEAYDWPTRVKLRQYLERHRPETIRYWIKRLMVRDKITAVEALQKLDQTYPASLDDVTRAS